MVGSVRSAASGDKLIDSMLECMATQLATPLIGNLPGESGAAAGYRTIMAALIGGATSESTGGDFGSGALSASFTWLFNHESDQQHTHKNDLTAKDMEKIANKVLDEVEKWRSAIREASDKQIASYAGTSILSTDLVKLSWELDLDQIEYQAKLLKSGSVVKGAASTLGELISQVGIAKTGSTVFKVSKEVFGAINTANSISFQDFSVTVGCDSQFCNLNLDLYYY